ncbi:MAG: hypothetical protein H5T33_05440 [Candidatus Methanosuratus sp.]|nr:hypothetical protein [Candidatus Methanosuratincola sp.]
MSEERNLEKLRRWCIRKHGQYNDLDAYTEYYNNRRLHAGIGYLTPAEVYYER